MFRTLPLAQAVQSLIRQLLSKPDAELNQWRELLCQALNPDGALVVDLIPELKFVIGEQPPVPDSPTSCSEGAHPDHSSPVDRCVCSRRASPRHCSSTIFNGSMGRRSIC
jgi:hypothetical protein